MKLVKLEPGFYDVFYHGALIGEVQKKGKFWCGYKKGSDFYAQIIGKTCREAAVELVRQK